jgi:hypothetical protein
MPYKATSHMKYDPEEIASLQTNLTALWHQVEPSAEGEGFDLLLRKNHYFNFMLWHEEDIARRDDLGSERVHQAKRAIDHYNKMLVADLQPAESGVPKNSETPGMIIDRLSILALKEFHMREESERSDASEEHRANCAAKLARILHQRSDLTQCLGELIEAIIVRTRTFAVYYQFKMYNDPALNPQLYSGK